MDRQVMARRAGSLVAITLLVLGLTARSEAKMIPLEVQISEGSRTVRVSPDRFMEQMDAPGVGGYFGVFEFTPKPPELDDRPLDVTLFLYASRAEPGAVEESFGPGVRRETMVAFEYHRSGSGAVGRIVEAGDETYRRGSWVRFSSPFVALVEDAWRASPAVAAVDAPMSQPVGLERDPYLQELVLRLSVAGTVVLGLVIVLVGLRTSRKARERLALGGDQPTASVGALDG